MTTRLPVLLIATLCLAAVPVFAKKAPQAPDNRPIFSIVVVDSLLYQQGAITDYDRLDMAFTALAKERQWPMRIQAERFAANTPAHETELRIFNQPLREETLGDITFRGWMTLTAAGRKHDFGIITFRHYVRPGENLDEILEKVFRGAAEAAAVKIEPILFPKPAAVPAKP
ncbi:MAG: hypothetical protein PSV13_00240 [Lacunisphaera sp.]|nr:hypothetical protein [Lacunisphaera sp.]